MLEFEEIPLPEHDHGHEDIRVGANGCIDPKLPFPFLAFMSTEFQTCTYVLRESAWRTEITARVLRERVDEKDEGAEHDQYDEQLLGVEHMRSHHYLLYHFLYIIVMEIENKKSKLDLRSPVGEDGVASSG
jgi:hypothetical protein